MQKLWHDWSQAQNCKNKIRKDDASQGNSYNGAFCHRPGHLKNNCFKLKRAKAKITV